MQAAGYVGDQEEEIEGLRDKINMNISNEKRDFVSSLERKN